MRHNAKSLIADASPIIRTVRKAGLATEFLTLKEEAAKKRQLEGRLRHSQKMEAIGQLAGAVAHDFNNILMAIRMGLALVREKPELTPETRDALKEIDGETARCANLTRQLLSFSRHDAARIECLNAAQVISNQLIMLRRLLGENIEVCFQIPRDSIWINADVCMVEQIILNLCLNARDAMPCGGQLRLSAAQVEVQPEELEAPRHGQPARFVCISVSDTGCGMDETVLNRIFEPFFTTKEVGKGTGLGLATVHGIVQQLQGWIEVDSAVGRGATFRVFLPEANPPDSVESRQASEQPSHGSETILLVEDDTSVRRLVGAWLRNFGYTVLEAGDSSEALNLWGQRQDDIALLFTDMMMPGALTGLDLALQLKKARPGLRIISSSGYGANEDCSPLVPGDEIVYLPKPYAPEVLATTVRNCLDQPSRSICS